MLLRVSLCAHSMTRDFVPDCFIRLIPMYCPEYAYVARTIFSGVSKRFTYRISVCVLGSYEVGVIIPFVRKVTHLRRENFLKSEIRKIRKCYSISSE